MAVALVPRNHVHHRMATPAQASVDRSAQANLSSSTAGRNTLSIACESGHPAAACLPGYSCRVVNLSRSLLETPWRANTANPHFRQNASQKCGSAPQLFLIRCKRANRGSDDANKPVAAAHVVSRGGIRLITGARHQT